MSNLYEDVATKVYDNLIADIYPPTEVFAVTIRKVAGEVVTLKRGTVLAVSSGTAGDGKMVVLGNTAGSNETLTANCILAEDVEVGTSVDTTALAYRTGHFQQNNLIVKDEYTLSAADKEALRNVGILLSESMEY